MQYTMSMENMYKKTKNTSTTKAISLKSVSKHCFH